MIVFPQKSAPAEFPAHSYRRGWRVQSGRVSVALVCLVTIYAAIFLSGCSHTSPMVLPENTQSISIPLVINQTLEYGAEERVTDILIQEFLRDGRLRVVSPDRADLLMQATLTRYDLRPISFNERQEGVSFRLESAMKVSLRNLRTGQFLFENEEFTENGVFFLSNRPGEQREEQIFTRMAESIISRFMEGW